MPHGSEPPSADASAPTPSRAVLRIVLPGVLAVAVVAAALVVADHAAPGPRSSGTTSPGSTSPAGPSPAPPAATDEMPAPAPTGPPQLGGVVTTDPRLPSAEPMTADVWAGVGSGWVLATYQERGPAGAAGSPGPQVVYLISPQGVRYELTRIPGDATVQVVAWTPGTSTAVALAGPPPGTTTSGTRSGLTWVRLDLGTGATTPIEVTAAPPLEWKGPVAPRDGGDIAVSNQMAVNGDGDTILIGDADRTFATAVAARYPDYTRCGSPVAADSRWSVIACERDLPAPGDPGARAPMILKVRHDGDIVVLATPTPADGPAPSGPITLVRGVVVVEGSTRWSTDGCTTGMYRLDKGVFTPLPGVVASSFPSPSRFTVVGSTGSSVYTTVTGGCGAEGLPLTLVRDDLATGEHVELVPYPADGAGLVASLTGAYVVP